MLSISYQIPKEKNPQLQEKPPKFENAPLKGSDGRVAFYD
jgi:hypothetical protein